MKPKPISIVDIVRAKSKRPEPAKTIEEAIAFIETFKKEEVTENPELLK